MSAVVNDRDVLLQAAGTRLATVAGPSNLRTDFDWINGTHKPDDNADVTQTAIIAGVTITGGGVTLNAGGNIKGGQTAYDTGTGFFLGYSSSLYRFSIGNASGNKLTWNGTVLGIVGAISGASSLDITGNAIFGGAFSDGTFNTALSANSSLSATYGVIGYAKSGGGGAGVSGTGGGNGTAGVSAANTGTGTGVLGIAVGSGGSAVIGSSSHASGFGVWAENTGVSGVALKVSGAMTISVSTLVTNLNAEKWNGNTAANTVGTGASTATFDGTAKPGSSTTNSWWAVTINGTVRYIPVWN